MKYRKAEAPPRNLLELKSMIASRSVKLPDRLERVVREAVVRPEVVAFGTTRSMAEICGVSPTTVSRTAIFLGFQSFRDMRRLFGKHIRHDFLGS